MHSQPAATHRARPTTISNANSLITYALVLTSLLIGLLLFVDWLDRTEEPGERQQPFYYSYEGDLNVSQAYFVHLVTALDLLVRLTPLHSDPDLFISTGKEYDHLLSRLPQVHQAKCLPSVPLYEFELALDELIYKGGTTDINRFFSLQSSSFGVEELPVLRDYPHGDLSIQTPRPILLVVRAYPGFLETVRFRLEVFPHRPNELRYDELRQVVDEGSLSFEELAMRYATFPEMSDTFDDQATPVQTDSSPLTITDRLLNGLNSFEPLVTALLDGLFDALL